VRLPTDGPHPRTPRRGFLAVRLCRLAGCPSLEKGVQPSLVTCFAPRGSLPRPGWLEQDLEEILQGKLHLPLRSKPTGRTIVRVTSAVSRRRAKCKARSGATPPGCFPHPRDKRVSRGPTPAHLLGRFEPSSSPKAAKGPYTEVFTPISRVPHEQSFVRRSLMTKRGNVFSSPATPNGNGLGFRLPGSALGVILSAEGASVGV
jgi:hypothetical protein